mmetsp:Transcript_34529/g.95096  ORF Transcript_34529/g.95096 Transcript_34529/m.95096 type:complete len:493 (+) Transcript_34529:160-1638(+)
MVVAIQYVLSVGMLLTMTNGEARKSRYGNIRRRAAPAYPDGPKLGRKHSILHAKCKDVAEVELNADTIDECDKKASEEPQCGPFFMYPTNQNDWKREKKKCRCCKRGKADRGPYDRRWNIYMTETSFLHGTGSGCKFRRGTKYAPEPPFAGCQWNVSGGPASACTLKVESRTPGYCDCNGDNIHQEGEPFFHCQRRDGFKCSFLCMGVLPPYNQHWKHVQNKRCKRAQLIIPTMQKMSYAACEHKCNEAHNCTAFFRPYHTKDQTFCYFVWGDCTEEESKTGWALYKLKKPVPKSCEAFLYPWKQIIRLRADILNREQRRREYYQARCMQEKRHIEGLASNHINQHAFEKNRDNMLTKELLRKTVYVRTVLVNHEEASCLQKSGYKTSERTRHFELAVQHKKEMDHYTRLSKQLEEELRELGADLKSYEVHLKRALAMLKVAKETKGADYKEWEQFNASLEQGIEPNEARSQASSGVAPALSALGLWMSWPG